MNVRKLETAVDAASRAMHEVLSILVENGMDSPELRQVTADWHFKAVDVLAKVEDIAE